MYWKVTEARFRRWNSAKPNLHSNEGSSALWGWQLWHKKGLALFICDSRCLCSTVLGDVAEEVKYKKLSLFKLVRRAARKAQPVCVFFLATKWLGRWKRKEIIVKKNKVNYLVYSRGQVNGSVSCDGYSSWWNPASIHLQRVTTEGMCEVNVCSVSQLIFFKWEYDDLLLVPFGSEISDVLVFPYKCCENAEGCSCEFNHALAKLVAAHFTVERPAIIRRKFS